MVESIEIQGLRGIREGKVEGLTPLTILVGPNGCGKSTVLDALLIGTSDDWKEVIGSTVAQRIGVTRAVRWLFWKVGKSAAIRVNHDSKSFRKVSLTLHSLDLATAQHNSALVEIEGWWQERGYGWMDEPISFDPDNRHSISYDRVPFEIGPPVRLLEAHRLDGASHLHDLYSEVQIEGRGEQALAMLRSVVPTLKTLQILTEASKPDLYLALERGSIPVRLAGDGIHVLVRLCLELASFPGGLVLCEEPEVHQHPRAIAQSSRAIWAAVRRGVQVIATTHSLELIDSLLAETESDEEVEKYSVQRLSLHGGVLSTYRIAGADLAEMRVTIEEDLR